MKPFARASLAVSLSLGLAAPAIGLADNCGGHYSSVTESASNLEVAKNHSIAYWTTRQTADSDNSGYNGVGMCNGYALTSPDGKVRMSGACALKTKDGDSWSYTWGMEPGADRGWWKSAAGTGIFAGKDNSGWYQPTVTDGKTSMGIWGGTCK